MRRAMVGMFVLVLGSSMLGVAEAHQPSLGTTAVTSRTPGRTGWTNQAPPAPGMPPAVPPPGVALPPVSDEQLQQMQQQMEREQQRYVELLATNLHLDPATVKAALDQTQADLKADRIAEIQQAVRDGKLSQDQADQIIQSIQAGLMAPPPPPIAIPGLPPGPPR